MTWMKAAVAGLAMVAASALVAQAETRVTYKSAKSGTSYYQMGVEIAEAMKRGSDGAVIVTVEESQGSVQNVMEAAVRPGSYVFTTPPALVGAAQKGSGPFKDKGNPKFDEIRALFPIPSLTMHFVMREEAGAVHMADLAGKTILLGKGSFGAREGEKYVEMFGLKDKVTIADAELSNAVAALKNGQIDGFVTAGSYPAPNVIEAAASVPITLITMSVEQIAETNRTALVIPAGTYAGVDTDTVTTSLPVVAYTTTSMDDDTAYQLTKTFWGQKAEMAGTSPWWGAVDAAMLANVVGKIHPGALRYYEEAGVEVPESAK